MQCPSCKSEDTLLGRVRIDIWAPVTKDGSSIKVGGVGITRPEIKEKFNKGFRWNKGPQWRDIHRGPIVCSVCESHFLYNTQTGEYVPCEYVPSEEEL